MDDQLADDFAEFWYRYPRRVGKLAAMRAYIKARRIATAAVILEGVARYVASRPPRQFTAHAATWLNAGRWEDEIEAPHNPRADPFVSLSDLCEHEPVCPNTWSHGKLLKAEQSGDVALVEAVKRLYARQVSA